MRKTTLLATLMLLTALPAAQAQFDHSHAAFDALLKEYVDKEGLVNYPALRANRAKLDSYLESLGKVTGKEINSWNKDQKIAFWSNAYNAFTLKHIIDHYPIQRSKSLKARLYPQNSIRQIDGVWDKLKNIAGGRQITLSDIEHKVLREELKDARVHFVIVCASIGCPLLADHAYSADKLDEQFEEASRLFVQNTDKIKVDTAKKTIYLSKILDWFKEDFDSYKGQDKYGKYNGVMSFVAEHLSDSDKAALNKAKFKIKWLDYDWSLNEQ